VITKQDVMNFPLILRAPKVCAEIAGENAPLLSSDRHGHERL